MTRDQVSIQPIIANPTEELFIFTTMVDVGPENRSPPIVLGQLLVPSRRSVAQLRTGFKSLSATLRSKKYAFQLLSADGNFRLKATYSRTTLSRK